MGYAGVYAEYALDCLEWQPWAYAFGPVITETFVICRFKFFVQCSVFSISVAFRLVFVQFCCLDPCICSMRVRIRQMYDHRIVVLVDVSDVQAGPLFLGSQNYVMQSLQAC